MFYFAQTLLPPENPVDRSSGTGMEGRESE